MTDASDSSDDDLTREELPEDLSEYETVARLLQASQGYGYDDAREAAMDRVEADELLELPCVVARSLGTADGVQPREPGDRPAPADGAATNEELYRVHIRERVEPELRFGTRSTVRSAVENAIADSDYSYADFGADPVATAVIERYEGGTLTEYDERVRTIGVHLETAARD